MSAWVLPRCGSPLFWVFWGVEVVDAGEGGEGELAGFTEGGRYAADDFLEGGRWEVAASVGAGSGRSAEVMNSILLASQFLPERAIASRISRNRCRLRSADREVMDC